MQDTELAIIQEALNRLGDDEDEMREVVADLVRSGFDEVTEIVEFAKIARGIAQTNQAH